MTTGNVFGTPHLAVERDTPYIKSNFTVVGVSAYEFHERPRFKWTWDGKLAVASLPRTVADLEPYENKVRVWSIISSFFFHSSFWTSA